MNSVRDRSLAFVLLCCVTATTILRPAELVPGLAGAPIYETLIFAALLLSHRRVLQLFRPAALKCQPITLCLVGVAIAIPLSHLSHMYFGGALSSSAQFAAAAMLYVVVIAVVDRWERFEKLLTVIAAVSTVMVSLCVIDFLEISDLPFIKHVQEKHGVEATGADRKISRLSGPGIFSDPNDISLLIIATGVICLSFLMDRNRSQLRVFWLAPLTVLAIALVCTKSRGGMLAACGALGVLLMFRYGKRVAFVMGGLAVAALPFLGRQSELDLSEGTGHDRIQLWREGLASLRSSDIVFGTGYGTYADIAGLLAHNSFVHAFVELGLIGGTFFFGMFFFSALGLFRLNQPGWNIAHVGQAKFLPFMAAMGAGWTIGLLSLSHCYSVPTQLILGLGTAYLNLAGWNLRPRRLVVQWDALHIKRMAFASACTFIAFNVVVKVIA